MTDGRPMNTDVFLGKLFEACDDKYDRSDAIDEWLHGDWNAALEYLGEADHSAPAEVEVLEYAAIDAKSKSTYYLDPDLFQKSSRKSGSRDATRGASALSSSYSCLCNGLNNISCEYDCPAFQSRIQCNEAAR